MSGIEVAGIALAVFTVAINGISHFVEGMETIKYWRRYRIKLQGYAASMKAQKVFYLDTLEALFADIVESDEDLVVMMAEPGGLAWQRADYDKRLRQRLHRSYDVYLDVIRSMLNDLDSLCGQLGLSSTGEILWDQYSIVDIIMKRLKVTLSKNVHQDLIAGIDTANKTIREITRQNIYLEPIRETRRSQGFRLGLKRVRDYAESLYRALANDTTWKCQCKSLHLVSMRLESRSESLKRTSYTLNLQCRFHILLSNSHPSKSLPGILRWQELEIRSSIYPNHATNSSSNLMPKDHSGESKSVISDKVITLAPYQPLDSSMNSNAAIANLCSIVWRDSHTRGTIGFLSDEQNYSCRETNSDCKLKHYLYPVDTLPADKSQYRSLHDVLCETRNNSPLGTLLKRERLELAITLASSVLLLDGTSWLNSQWSSHDISFYSNLGGNPTPLTHPYLSWRQCADGDDLSVTTRALTIGNHMIRNENLFALGLTLIEICFGKPFSALHRPEDKDSIDDVANAKCAFRLLAFVYDEMDGVYGDVVRRCLFQPFDVRHMDLNLEEVQQKVYAGIVAPLIENLEISRGHSGIR